MHNIKLGPNDAIAINHIRKDNSGQITHLSIQQGVDGLNKQRQKVHIFSQTDSVVTREEFIDLCKDCKTIWLAFRSFSNIPQNATLKPWEDVDGYLVNVNGTIYIRKDQQQIACDDIGYASTF
jgi:hypothetical protein